VEFVIIEAGERGDDGLKIDYHRGILRRLMA
jgi:hypothetical protein